jgi:hypothetical protein
VTAPSIAQAPAHNIVPEEQLEPYDTKACFNLCLEDTHVRDNAWEDIDLELPTDVATTVVTPSVSTYKTPERTSTQPSTTELKQDQAKVHTNVSIPSTATAFIDSRPGGPLQTQQQKMVTVERRVSMQLQKKATTSKEGRQALKTISRNVANQNETATPVALSLPAKRKSPSVNCPLEKTRQNRAKGNKRATGHATTQDAEVTKQVKTKVLSCKYGCKHGGLLNMQQMQPYDTRHYLGEGMYLHKKNCLDCKHNLGALFKTSKMKAVFYYCQVDYNVKELTDDNKAKADSPCACILCIECYFSRETKKNTTMGKTNRSSSRGRVLR